MKDGEEMDDKERDAKIKAGKRKLFLFYFWFLENLPYSLVLDCVASSRRRVASSRRRVAS